ncbi:MAG: 4-(cytidine 5'-diphospho)-2-C-methyl-D-erythritol kinase [Thermoguttaceae bacterium]
MHLRETRQNAVIHTPGKVNLFFEVLGRRSDGFHEVETLVYPIDLLDTLVVRKRPDRRIELRVQRAFPRVGGAGVSFGEIPADSSNLVVRALDLVRQASGTTWGADVLLIKRIPSEAGLGGGSSDAAAALVAANVVWGLGLGGDQMAKLGARLGSDVPLFLRSGASVCRGRGEIVESAPAWPLLHLVLLRPPAGLRTAEVYGRCRVPDRPRSLCQILPAFASADLGRIGHSLFNRLESPAGELTPWIARARGAFEKLDCVGHCMTGSGTCYFGLCRHARHARRVARRLESYGLGQSYVVRGIR